MIDSTRTLAELVLEHAAFAPVFARLGLDYCCKGERSLERAALDAGVELGALIAELERAFAAPGDDEDPRRRSTASLVAYLVVRYHDALRETLPFVCELAAKVARVHGAHEPALRELDVHVQGLATQLLEHLDMEETALFPALMQGAPLDAVATRMLSEMESEHREMGASFEHLRTLTSGYTPSASACRSYRTLFSTLQEMESELFRHVHVENHVLAPRFALR